MIKNIELEKGAYQFDAKMPLRQAIPLGLSQIGRGPGCFLFIFSS